MRMRWWAQFSLLTICYSTSLAAQGRAPCSAHPTQPGWHVFIDTKNRFCFEYPPDDEENGIIDVVAHGTPFHPSKLLSFAPTGSEDIPPKLIHTIHQEFYYYGPGGGGVDYPDSFYFELHGLTFALILIGPYAGDKTPAAVTKQIEPKLLASFRRF